jgi:hypothetical protein
MRSCSDRKSPWTLLQQALGAVTAPRENAESVHNASNKKALVGVDDVQAAYQRDKFTLLAFLHDKRHRRVATIAYSKTSFHCQTARAQKPFKNLQIPPRHARCTKDCSSHSVHYIDKGIAVALSCKYLGTKK